MIYAAVVRRLVISIRVKLLSIKLLINQSICNQNATLSAIKSIKSMLSVYWDQSIQVDLQILIVLLVDNSAWFTRRDLRSSVFDESAFATIVGLCMSW